MWPRIIWVYSDRWLRNQHLVLTTDLYCVAFICGLRPLFTQLRILQVWQMHSYENLSLLSLVMWQRKIRESIRSLFAQPVFDSGSWCFWHGTSLHISIVSYAIEDFPAATKTLMQVFVCKLRSFVMGRRTTQYKLILGFATGSQLCLLVLLVRNVCAKYEKAVE